MNLRGRDQEDCSWKPAWANSETLSYKHPLQKRAGGVSQGIGPEFGVIPALSRLRQEKSEFEAALCYIIRFSHKRTEISPVLVAHTCDLSCLDRSWFEASPGK
jgi:hypothetical protein